MSICGNNEENSTPHLITKLNRRWQSFFTYELQEGIRFKIDYKTKSIYLIREAGGASKLTC